MDDAPRLRTRFDRDDESTGLVLWQVTNRWQAAQRAALKPFGLTHVQFVLLASLTWLSSQEEGPITGPVNQRALADYAGTDVMMTSQVVRALESKGWLSREKHAVDRRAIALVVTAEGLRVVNEAVGAVERCDDEFFAPLSNRRDDFTALLGAL